MSKNVHQPKMPDSVKNIICIFFMLTGCLLIYSNSIKVPFTFDDRPFIVNDTSVHLTDLSVNNLLKAAYEGSPGHRPFSNVSFSLNYYFNQLQPAGYHLVNILIHFLSGVFLFFLIGFVASFAFSMGSVVFVLLAEVFPNRIRSRGVAISSFAVWFVNGSITFLFPVVAGAFRDGIGIGFSFVFFSVMTFAGFFIFRKFLFETSNMTLEEIERRNK